MEEWRGGSPERRPGTGPALSCPWGGAGRVMDIKETKLKSAGKAMQRGEGVFVWVYFLVWILMPLMGTEGGIEWQGERKMSWALNTWTWCGHLQNWNSGERSGMEMKLTEAHVHICLVILQDWAEEKFTKVGDVNGMEGESLIRGEQSCQISGSGGPARSSFITR